MLVPEPIQQRSAARPEVDSRWWYWIAAYPLATLLVVPVMAVLAVVVLAPAVIISPNPMRGFAPGWMILLFAAVIVFVTLLLGLVIVFTMLPVALWFDASAINEAHLEWEPDPVVYALVSLLQFVVTPLVGLVVALYYLYRRHQTLGVP